MFSIADTNIAQTEITLTDNQGKDLVFYIAVIETKDKYYKFYGWTAITNQNVLVPDYKNIVKSFKL